MACAPHIAGGVVEVPEEAEEVEEAAGQGDGEAAGAAGGARVPRGRSRGTAVLVAAAAALGLVAGTCVGYVVQAGRAPTKLPSLAQPTLARATGPAPEPLSVAQDRRVGTEGDLRKLLLRKPRGAKDAPDLMGADGWLDLASYARTYEKPRGEFADLISEEFRRAAVTGWQVGSTYTVEIRLIQFRQEEQTAASGVMQNDQYWATHDSDSFDEYSSPGDPSVRRWAVPGTESGMAYVHTRPGTGRLPQYAAEAYAWRGDVAVEIWVMDARPISKAKIMDLAQRQMEQL